MKKIILFIFLLSLVNCFTNKLYRTGSIVSLNDQKLLEELDLSKYLSKEEDKELSQHYYIIFGLSYFPFDRYVYINFPTEFSCSSRRCSFKQIVSNHLINELYKNYPNKSIIHQPEYTSSCEDYSIFYSKCNLTLKTKIASYNFKEAFL